MIKFWSVFHLRTKMTWLELIVGESTAEDMLSFSNLLVPTALLYNFLFCHGLKTGSSQASPSCLLTFLQQDGEPEG